MQFNNVQSRRNTNNITNRKKDLVDVYLLAICLGMFGAHHFYLRRWFFGYTYLFTFGLFGIGYVVDLFRLQSLVDDEFDRRQNPKLKKKKLLFDAYLLWFPCGIFGLHYFFLEKKYKWAVLYIFTGGMFGIGWLIDLYRMPSLVKLANDDHPDKFKLSLSAAYILALSPLGLFGAHHFYLRRKNWGLLYVFTFGLFGIGWLVDLFRLSKLVNRVLQGATGQKKVYLDDAYILWLFPLGLFGVHHFYLDRRGWGYLYICTFGIYAVGWLVDIIRLPRLVTNFNALKYKQNALKDKQYKLERRRTDVQLF